MIKAKMKKIAASAIAVTSILMVAPINVYAEWKELENDHYGYIENNELYKGWKLLDYTCLYKGEGLSEDSSVEKAWYYFDENGIMKTDSWVKSGDKWFYLDSNGAMIKDCIKNGYAFGKDGAWIPGPGWIQSDGKWYYLNEDGRLAKNTSINDYILGEDGVWIEEIGQVNYTQNFVTVPEKSVYPLGTKTVNYYVINNTGDVYTYMVWASSLEKYEDNKWVRLTNKSLEELQEYMKKNPDFYLGEDYRTIYKVYSSKIDLTDFKEFDSSKPGKYRIPFDGGKDTDNMYVEFEIK